MATANSTLGGALQGYASQMYYTVYSSGTMTTATTCPSDSPTWYVAQPYANTVQPYPKYEMEDNYEQYEKLLAIKPVKANGKELALCSKHLWS